MIDFRSLLRFQKIKRLFAEIHQEETKNNNTATRKRTVDETDDSRDCWLIINLDFEWVYMHFVEYHSSSSIKFGMFFFSCSSCCCLNIYFYFACVLSTNPNQMEWARKKKTTTNTAKHLFCGWNLGKYRLKKNEDDGNSFSLPQFIPLSIFTSSSILRFTFPESELSIVYHLYIVFAVIKKSF